MGVGRARCLDWTLYTLECMYFVFSNFYSVHNMKGYLKGNDGIFQLALRVTTVGREGCDLVLRVSCLSFSLCMVNVLRSEKGILCLFLEAISHEANKFDSVDNKELT